MEDNYLKVELYKLIKEDPNLFDFIQAGSLDGIWYWDLENTENEWMSPKFWQTLGYDPSEKKHLSSEWQEIIFKDDFKIAEENFQKHCTDPSYPYDQIVRYKHKDGSTVWIRCRGLAIRDKNGKPIRMLGSHLDITNLKDKEETIKNLSSECETVFNTTQDAIFLMEVDANEQVIYKRLNKSHSETTGLTNKMVAGKTASEIFGEETGAVLEENYKKCIKEKKPITYEEELTISSTTKVWSTTLSPVVKNGKVVQIVGAARDITESKKTEGEIVKEKERLKITLQSIGDGVIAIDNDMNIVFINAAAEKIIENKKESVLKKPIDQFLKVFHMNEPIDIKDIIQSIREADAPIQIFNETVTETNGHKKRISGMGATIKYSKGIVSGIVITFRDETESLKNREKLAYLSFHDSLTGLYNRAYFDEELVRLNTSRELPLSIIVGDGNGLKLSNDVFGHAAGDQLLISIAHILKESCRYEDVIARWGGDEFAVILPKTPYEDAAKICQRIKEKCHHAKAVPIKPSIALGIATKDEEDKDINKVIAAAEEMMYKNKLIEGKKVRIQIINSLQITLEERSIQTIEHSKRLSLLAKTLKDDFKLSDKECDQLCLLGDLHDIGTINISPTILLKPTSLVDTEWVEIKKHPEIGYRIAQSTVEFVHIADLILTHHEKWDGSGYPQGLKGEEIPKLSRILALFDAYDTMTHDRPYRKARSHEEAIQEIRCCSGSQFDSALAGIFITAINKFIQ